MSSSDLPDVQKIHDGVVPKVIGADVELANFFVDEKAPAGQTVAQIQDTSGDAARLLLSHIDGCPSGRAAATVALATHSYAYSFDSSDSYYGGYNNDWPAVHASGTDRPAYREHAQDRGRKFLAANGACAYIDLEHLELCTPETISAFDHVAACHAMLRIGRDALHRANAHMPPGRKVKLLATNSDGHNHSWGAHFSVLVTRECYENLFNRKMHYLQWLATYQCASLILTGAGKVGSEKGHGPAPYNISSRADFVETLAGPQTTFHRPLCNTRDEALADDLQLARIHIIFYDNTLCHTSMLLRAGITQIILAMCEQGQVPMCLLDDPIAAVHRFSRDPDLTARAAMAHGDRYSAVELLEAIFEHAQRFVAAGRTDGLVPRAADIMAQWGVCLDAFRRRDFDSLATKLDWVAKRFLLRRAVERRGVTWNSPLIKYYDQMWASLDPNEGLFYALERAGAVARLVSDADIERFVHQPPEDTRAWLRAAVLSRAAPNTLDFVDWDTIRLRSERTNRYGWVDYSYQTLSLKNPLAFTRQECAAILDAAPTLAEALERIKLAQTTTTSPFEYAHTDIPCVPPAITPVAGAANDSSTPTLQGD